MLKERLREYGRACLGALRAFRDDRQTHTAASLAYTTFLSLIPIAILLVVLVDPIATALDLNTQGGAGAAAGRRPDILGRILEYLAPDSQRDLMEFVKRTQSGLSANKAPLGLLGLGGFLVTSILLYLNIEDALNDVWRSPRRRSLPVRIAYFWGVATLVPVLLLLSLSVVSGAPVLSHLFDAPAMRSLFQLAVSGGLLALAYVAFPVAPVTWRAAIVGGVAAGAAFEILKVGFGAYVDLATSYQSLYGTLGAIPVFIIWTYLVWVVVLLGAQLARVVDHGPPRPAVPPPPDRVATAVAIEVARAFLAGEGPTDAGHAAVRLGLPPDAVAAGAERLCRAGLLAPVAGETVRFVPARDPRAVPAIDVLVAARDTGSDGVGGPALSAALARMDAAARAATAGLTLADLAGVLPGAGADSPKPSRPPA